MCAPECSCLYGRCRGPNNPHAQHNPLPSKTNSPLVIKGPWLVLRNGEQPQHLPRAANGDGHEALDAGNTVQRIPVLFCVWCWRQQYSWCGHSSSRLSTPHWSGHGSGSSLCVSGSLYARTRHRPLLPTNTQAHTHPHCQRVACSSFSTPPFPLHHTHTNYSQRVALINTQQQTTPPLAA